MIGSRAKSGRRRKANGLSIRCEALEARDLATSGLVGALGPADVAQPPAITLTLPAVQRCREAANR